MERSAPVTIYHESPSSKHGRQTSKRSYTLWVAVYSSLQLHLMPRLTSPDVNALVLFLNRLIRCFVEWVLMECYCTLVPTVLKVEWYD